MTIEAVPRIAEIEQENRGGDVSAKDIAWLCDVARAAQLVAATYATRTPHSDIDYYIAALKRKLVPGSGPEGGNA